MADGEKTNLASLHKKYDDDNEAWAEENKAFEENEKKLKTWKTRVLGF